MASSDGCNLFAGVIYSIKTYDGDDPLLPWLQGIKKLKSCLPPPVVKEKLPRFLQRCVSSFRGDGRYQNDPRYIRVWIQLMDYVDNPRKLLVAMEENHIGENCALFYQAYALYFEKLKKFEESEKMYGLGFKNFAEPAGELQKSHEQFIHRWNQHKLRRARISNDSDASRACMRVNSGGDDVKGLENPKPTSSKERLREGVEISGQNTYVTNGKSVCRDFPSSMKLSKVGSRKSESVKSSTFTSEEDTVVVKFVGSTIVGKSEEAEDACHHGLVDPTINMKEAMNAINNMFQEPLEVNMVRSKRSNRHGRSHPPRKGFEVFVDENMDEGANRSVTVNGGQMTRKDKGRDEPGPLEIFVDDEEERDRIPDNSVEHEVREPSDVRTSRDDTVFCKFVCSTIVGEHSVENACHHGLVDPTINMKEAMNDINGMFGKPIDFVKNRKLKNLKLPTDKAESGGFSIYVDSDAEKQHKIAALCSSDVHCLEQELNEPTIFTKEAMDDINEMFGRPLDF